MRLGLLRGPEALRLALHRFQAGVVVRELLRVGERDLAGHDRIIVRDIRLWIVRAVLELDIHSRAELLEIEPRPVDADRVTDAARLLGRRTASVTWTV